MNNLHSYVRYSYFELKFKIRVLSWFLRKVISSIRYKIYSWHYYLIYWFYKIARVFIQTLKYFFFILFLFFAISCSKSWYINISIIQFFSTFFQNCLYSFKYFKYLQVYKREWSNRCLYCIVNFTIVCSDLLQK